MIVLKDIITPTRIVLDANVTSKKRALEVLAKTIVIEDTLLDEQLVFEQLIERERLGSTGFGNGVAIPHCRLADCQQPIMALLKLHSGIDFSAIDEEPVDILVALVVPEASEDHLQLLKQVAGLLGNAETRAALRLSTDSQTIYQLITAETESNIG